MTTASAAIRRAALSTAAILALCIPDPTVAGPPMSQPLGANLYTTFWVNSGKTAINWSTCGSTQFTEGCYDGGTISAFARVCAILAGAQHSRDSTMTREIYVLDSGSISAANVQLKVFKQIDDVTTTSDTTTILLSRSVLLPIAGGSEAACSMAANDGFVFIGTNVSTTAVRIAKKGLSILTIGPYYPPIPFFTVTADEQGHVTMVFADPTSSAAGFTLFAPDGSIAEGGGGGELVFDNRNAYRPN